MKTNYAALAAAGAILLCLYSTAVAQSGFSQYKISGTEFNPAISLILQGTYSHFDKKELQIPGFQPGGEAGLAEQGLALGESELNLSANIDDLFYGSFTLGFHSADGELETEIEEAFIETLGLGHGVTLKAGRFFSDIGYLNQFHQHAWDFFDAPLVYTAMFGEQLIDDGVQLRWVAPVDLFTQISAEVLRGEGFPAAGAANDGVGAWNVMLNLGGDVGMSHSWQIGLTYYSADIENRQGGGHAHSDGDEEVIGVNFTGDNAIVGVDWVYKWAPNGNPTQRNFKLQGEYFQRSEDGDITLEETPLETTTFDGDQEGWYVQGVYQFMPKWRVGARYDELDADNAGSDLQVLAEAGLTGEGRTPRRYSAMVDYSHGEFSRIRLQYNRDEITAEEDDQFFVQYVMSLGAHGTHKF